MKYIKLFENTEKWKINRERLLNKVAYYFEDTIPITKEEGFVECLYSDAKSAYDWINSFNENSEPTFSWCKCEKVSNVKLDNRIEIAIATNKYNL